MSTKLEVQVQALQANIDQINTRLSTLEQLQSTGEDEAVLYSQEVSDLQQLRSDMQELLQLQQEELLEQRKQALLAMCDNMQQPSTEDDDDVSIVKVELPQDNHPQVSSTLAVGDRCQIPYWTNQGHRYEHMCIVCQVNLPEEKVRVMLAHPTRICDIPCEQWFLDEECSEGVLCRYSHGIVVDRAEILPYQPPVFESIQTGSRCLVQMPQSHNTEGHSSSSEASHKLWHHATVDFVDRESGSCVVKMATTQRLVNVKFAQMFPLQSSESHDSASSDASSEADDDTNMPSSGSVLGNIQTTERLGDWEVHTRGIGSKLMAQMGYIPGEGLGSESQGRVFAIPIELLPTGRSLDEVMRLREASIHGALKAFDPFHKGHKRRRMENRKAWSEAKTGKQSETKPRESRGDVFDFINSTTSGHKGSSFTTLRQKESTSKSSNHELSDKNLNVKMLQLHDEISRVRRELQKAQLGPVSGKVQRVETLQKRLAALEESERRLAQEKLGRKSRRSLAVF